MHDAELATFAVCFLRVATRGGVLDPVLAERSIHQGLAATSAGGVESLLSQLRDKDAQRVVSRSASIPRALS